MVIMDDKAQLHTLEGVAAATILILVITYVIDATSMTPLTSSTSNVHMESELKAFGQDILNTMDYAEPGYSSKLRSDIANWDGKGYAWNGTGYVRKGLNGPGIELKNNLTDALRQILISRSIQHDVEITYVTISDNIISLQSINMINNGDPSNNAVKVSRKLVLHDGDINITKFPYNTIRDIDSSTDIYNIVDIEIVLWRT